MQHSFSRSIKTGCLLLMAIFSCQLLVAQSTIIKYLSGTDKDHTTNWEFYCTKGMNSGKWRTIPVPSNWELQGFGAYNYGHDEKEKGNTKKKSDEKGLYKYHFKADKNWASKQIEIVFEGVMTDAEVKLNGQLVGPIHQGSFYRFQYNITPFIKLGADNLLEVTVSKISADSSVNKAEREGDFWVFGGIYRPVYLKILPATFVQRVAINAKADASFTMDVFTENIQAGDEVIAQVSTLKGAKFGASFSEIAATSDKISLAQTFKNPLLWNPETPNLYQVEVRIKRKNILQHSFTQRFGFRTVEVKKGDGIYVNNKKIVMKGVNRHSVWPETGRTLSRAVHLIDIALMKDMNMNAVRMSHYPPDAEFLDLCDSLGLFVLDELTGWHQKYATPVGRKLVKELVIRDVNHPSILFWDNGNEGGWNTDLDNDYALYDPQKRTVLHPWNNFNNVDTKHYPDYTYVENVAAKETIVLHTEMIHGLYDGGHGAGLDDYWQLFKKNPHHAGGFLWVLSDEGIVRKDKNDSIDTDGNHAPDGIVGPHREKEGSYYTIKEIWSPVQVAKPLLDKDFKGSIAVENNYSYTNLSACKFSWQLIKYAASTETKTGHLVIASGNTTSNIAAGKTGTIQLQLPTNWQKADAITFTAINQYGHQLYTWVWPIQSPMAIAKNYISKAKSSLGTTKMPSIKEEQKENTYTIIDGTGSNNITYNFDTVTGYLQSIYKNKVEIPFGEGPILAEGKTMLQKFRHYKNGNGFIVEANYEGDVFLHVKWLLNAGMPAQLQYSYSQKDTANFYGITFSVDEAKIRGMKWLGGGPYHVWKNRLKGVTIDVWEKKYNNAITGETFNYPEFKGFHADMYWASIQTQEAAFTVYTDVEHLYLQMLQPAKPNTQFVPYVNPVFPKQNFGFLNAITPIGTKFRAANTMGPQSQKNNPLSQVVSGNLWFDFRK